MYSWEVKRIAQHDRNRQKVESQRLHDWINQYHKVHLILNILLQMLLFLHQGKLVYLLLQLTFLQSIFHMIRLPPNFYVDLKIQNLSDLILINLAHDDNNTQHNQLQIWCFWIFLIFLRIKILITDNFVEAF